MDTNKDNNFKVIAGKHYRRWKKNVLSYNDYQQDIEPINKHEENGCYLLNLIYGCFNFNSHSVT
jgi:hypothetical protein